MPTTLPPDVEAQAINIIRGFAMDAPLRAKSGHQGTAMALAPLANVLYSRILKHDPDDPEWPDRDRFILSNGHASILQYSMLYLSRLRPQLADIEAFRSFDSRTPGHPEARHTPGIEVTTGPLGQGFGDAVGMAIAERVLRERFGSQLVDHHTYVIAGDGCFMEGVSHEAASLAGHLGLGRLICVYDDNRVTIDGSDRAVATPTTSAVASPPTAGTSTTSARSATTATPSRPRCSRPRPTTPARTCSSCARTSARRRPTTPTTRPPTATRSRPRTSPAPRRSWASRTSRSGRPRRSSPPTATPCAERVQRRQGGVGRGVRRPRRRRAGGVGRGLERHRPEGLGGRPADVRAGRGDGHPPGDGQGPRRRVRPVPRA